MQYFKIIAFLFVYCAFSSNSYSYLNEGITKKNLQLHVNFLSSLPLEGRLTGTKGEWVATRYVAKRFLELGLEPAGEKASFFQEFTFTTPICLEKNLSSLKDIKRHHCLARGYNVLAKLNITDPTAPIIIISAHLDHLGRGELNSSRKNNHELGMIHPGADDNASGVASILEVAAKLTALNAQGKLHGRVNILFAAWSGEELGILGSSYFAENLLKSIPKQSSNTHIKAAINLDMIGHLKKNLVLQGIGSSPGWPSIINEIKANHAINLLLQKDPYLPTDTTAFYLHGVPIINFFTGAEDTYHTPRDKAETLNYLGMKDISNFLADLVVHLINKSPELAYRAIEKKHYQFEQGFKVYLGTIPNYASSNIIGVKISGVIKGSPAEKAGLKQDDVIIRLAGRNIHSIYDYTFILNSLKVKKSVKIMVLRNRSRIILHIIPQSRG